MMQTSISAEEFSRYQSQLLELRQQKYAADETCANAIKQAKAFEDLLAAQSGELADIRSQLSRVQHAGDIDSVVQENYALRQQLINIESSFQLQINTLRGECDRLQSDNHVLLVTLKAAGCVTPSKDDHISSDNCCQTKLPNTASTPCQTNVAPKTAPIQTQTNVTSLDLQALFVQLEGFASIEDELEETRQSLMKEQMRGVEQHDKLSEQLVAQGANIEELTDQNEALRSELATLQRRSDKVQKELRRQLTSVMQKTTSVSSLVFINSSQDAGLEDQATNIRALDSETTSNCSFSIYPLAVANSGSGNASDLLDHRAMSDTSSNKSSINLIAGASFSEEDFRSLLNRLSEVQEDNCTLRMHLKHVLAELDAKSFIIQQRLGEKITPASPLQNTSKSSPDVTVLPQDSSSSTILSTALASVKSKFKLLESSTAPSNASVTSTSELRNLKQLCEELMTRNIFLEQALEETLTRARQAEAHLT